MFRNLDFDNIFVGNFIHCPKEFSFEVLADSYLATKGGRILSIGAKNDLSPNILRDQRVIYMNGDEFMVPGFIDTHIHAPQYPNIGIGYDKTLLDWLQHYTYPLEAKFSDLNFAERVYDKVVQNSLRFGTTTACYFGTIHLNGCLKLVDSLIKYGQRGFVGKVNMNRFCPSGYKESTEESIESTVIFVNSVLEKKNNLVQPVVTPRFAVSCDAILLKQLGELADKLNLNIQSHISESKNEVAEVNQLFPNRSYADVYNEAGLLTPKTVMAHGIYLSEEEIELFAEKGSSISHCPISNTCLKSGLLDVSRLWERNVNVSLGTDVSGGYSISMMEVMRNAISVSNHIAFGKDSPSKSLDFKDVFYMATLAGAKALKLDHKIGNFESGKEFDAILIQIDHDNQSLEDRLQKFINIGDDRMIKQVYVAGCCFIPSDYLTSRLLNKY